MGDGTRSERARIRSTASGARRDKRGKAILAPSTTSATTTPSRVARGGLGRQESVGGSGGGAAVGVLFVMR